MADVILKNDNADNNAVAAIQAGFASLNTNLASVNAGLQSLAAANANLQNLAAANADILRTLKTTPAAPHCCGCFYPCAYPCCGGQNNVGGVGCNIVYAVYDGYKNNQALALASYLHPLSSQAEADAVDVLIYLGGNMGAPVSFGGAFTLDGFAMPGSIQMDVQTVDTYPRTFLRKKGRLDWICLNRQDVMHIDSDFVNVAVSADLACHRMDNRDNQEQMCCGLYEHKCRGKVFTARIIDAENWTEEQRKQQVYFTLKKDTVFYDSFPENLYPEYAYSTITACTGYESRNFTWGDFIKKYGNKPFGVRIPADGIFVATAFAIN